MTTDERLDYERADQENDGAYAQTEAAALFDEAHDAIVKLGHVADMAQCAVDAPSPGNAMEYLAEARVLARRVAEITGGWG